MKTTIKIGDFGSLRGVVGPEQTITLGESPAATVLSTPSMINLMEHAAREALRPFLESGEESVGIDVQVEHLAATPPGTEVTATATVNLIENNVIGFVLEARDAWELIGRGTHRRAVIRTDKFADRLADKKLSPSPSSTSRELPKLKLIDLHRENRLLWATLNRPAKRNAFNQAMTEDLEKLVDWLADYTDHVGVVIFSGAGDSFSAGDDVTELRPDDQLSMASLSLRRGDLYGRMTDLPQILIAAIDGMALGGGFVCACACDIRIATYNAVFGLPEVKLGWPPNYGLQIVQSILGRSNALRLAVSGDSISSAEAQRLNIVHQIVPAFRLQQEARRYGEAILALPALSVAATKQLFSVSSDQSDKAATQAFLKCLPTHDAITSIRKFNGR